MKNKLSYKKSKESSLNFKPKKIKNNNKKINYKKKYPILNHSY